MWAVIIFEETKILNSNKILVLIVFMGLFLSENMAKKISNYAKQRLGRCFAVRGTVNYAKRKPHLRSF